VEKYEVYFNLSSNSFFTGGYFKVTDLLLSYLEKNHYFQCVLTPISAFKTQKAHLHSLRGWNSSVSQSKSHSLFLLPSLGANACCTSGDCINNCPLPLNATRFITAVNLRASAQVSACARERGTD
jgi:hypothetical protein